MKNYKKGELAKDIIKALAVGGLVFASLALPGLPSILKIFNATDRKEKERIKKAIDRLERDKNVEIYKKNGYDIVKITKRGREKILKYKLEEMKINKTVKWDGFWRIVMFDIPESKKVARDSLSLKLREMGFYAIQKSVFINPFESSKEVKFIGEYFGVIKYISYIIAVDINDSDFLKEKFSL